MKKVYPYKWELFFVLITGFPYIQALPKPIATKQEWLEKLIVEINAAAPQPLWSRNGPFYKCCL